MRLRRQLRRRRARGQVDGVAVGEGVRGVAQAIGVDGVGRLRADRGAKLLGEAGQAGIVEEVALRVVDDRLAQARQLQRRQHGADVAESLVECRPFERRRIPQIGFERVEDRVAHLMAEDVRAFAREDRGARAAGAVEEIQRLPVVEGIEVGAFVEQDAQRRAGLPAPAGDARGPIIRAAAQGLDRDPVTELRRSRVVGARRRGGMRKHVGQRPGGGFGSRAQDGDMRQGVVLPAADGACGLGAGARRDRRGGGAGCLGRGGPLGLAGRGLTG